MDGSQRLISDKLFVCQYCDGSRTRVNNVTKQKNSDATFLTYYFGYMAKAGKQASSGEEEEAFGIVNILGKKGSVDRSVQLTFY